MLTNSSNQKLVKHTINIEFLVSSQNIIIENLVNIPISINRSQTGTENLFIGKSLTVFIYDKKIVGTYQQKIDNTEYLRIDSVTQLSSQNIEFNQNTMFTYIDIPKNLNDNIALTINDVKRLFVTSKNNNQFKGVTGLLEPLHLEAIESIKFIREISQKSISELVAYTTVIYYEVPNNETNSQIQFGLFHSLFNVEYELKVFGSNYTLKTVRFGSAEILNNLSVGITINKIPSNNNAKKIYQILIKLNNVPQTVQSNVEKVKCYVNENLTNLNIYSTLPGTYTLSNLQTFISDKIYTRNILFYDNNGVVSINPNESVKLLGGQNLNNITNFGWYHYDVLNPSDILLNNLPTGANLKNVFYLNVKRLTDDLLIQYIYIHDTLNNVVKTFSRIRNNTTLVFTPWIEYVTANHKHTATDIQTDPNHLFVTQQQIDTWNSYQVSLSDYWNNAVVTVSELPSTGLNGECRLVLSTMKIYAFVAQTSTWRLITDTTLSLNFNSDYVKISVNEGGANREIELPLVTDNNPGIVPADYHATDWKNLFESNLNYTNENTGTDVPGTYIKQLGKTFNIIKKNSDKIKDGIENYLIKNSDNILTEIDISDISNIDKTFFSIYDNNNILNNVVTNFNFIIIPQYSGTVNLKLPLDRTINVYNENGVLETNINIIENNILKIFKEGNKKYHIEITPTNITILTLRTI